MALFNLSSSNLGFHNNGGGVIWPPFKDDTTFDFFARDIGSLALQETGGNDAEVVGGYEAYFNGSGSVVFPNVNLGKSHTISLHVSNLTPQLSPLLGNTINNVESIAIDSNGDFYYIQYEGSSIRSSVLFRDTDLFGNTYDLVINRDGLNVTVEYLGKTQIGTLIANEDFVIGSIGTRLTGPFSEGFISGVNLNNQAVYELNNHVYNSINGVEAENYGVTFDMNNSDALPSIKTALDNGYVLYPSYEQVINPKFAIPSNNPPSDLDLTVGATDVISEEYDTNNNSTTITVGATDADYTDLITAYSSASTGDVIELLDDTHSLSTRLNINKGVDVNGKAIKIIGKSTKTTLIMFNVTLSIQILNAGTSIEFENIIFKENNSFEPIRNVQTANDGFVHFINCELDGGQSPQFFNCKELVFDGFEFKNQVDSEAVRYVINTSSSEGSKAICNNVTCDYSGINTFFNNIVTDGYKTQSISITNSNIRINRNLILGIDTEVNTLDIRGNTLEAVGSSGLLNIGVEAVLDVLNEFDVYNTSTAYAIGDYVQYSANAWEATSLNTNSPPSKNSPDWKVAEVITGAIEHNTVKKTTYAASGHGLFIGFGCYNFSIKNNIITNFFWNYVVKGVNNSIVRNCAGIGYKGFSFFANDQYLISNNTSRSESDNAISLSFQYTSEGATNVDNTTVRDNIFTCETPSDVIFITTSILNSYNQNIYYGINPTATYNGVDYNLSISAEFDDFKLACGDVNALFINPVFEGTDPEESSYYKPTSEYILSLYDNEGASVGAVDYIYSRGLIVYPTGKMLNFIDCYVDLNPTNSVDPIFDIFDRSNTTIYNDDARLGYYDASNPFLWFAGNEDENELTYDKMNSFLNPAYQDRNFAALLTNYGTQLSMFRFFSYANQKTGDDLMKIKDYINYE